LSVTCRTTEGTGEKDPPNHWPLTPGECDVKLMLDDGFTELAATKLKVVA
jgi:hypothetical protein